MVVKPSAEPEETVTISSMFVEERDVRNLESEESPAASALPELRSVDDEDEARTSAMPHVLHALEAQEDGADLALHPLKGAGAGSALPDLIAAEGTKAYPMSICASIPALLTDYFVASLVVKPSAEPEETLTISSMSLDEREDPMLRIWRKATSSPPSIAIPPLLDLELLRPRKVLSPALPEDNTKSPPATFAPAWDGALSGGESSSLVAPMLRMGYVPPLLRLRHLRPSSYEASESVSERPLKVANIAQAATLLLLLPFHSLIFALLIFVKCVKLNTRPRKQHKK